MNSRFYLVFLITILVVGCQSSTAWLSKAAHSSGIQEQEARELARRASERCKMEAVMMYRQDANTIAVCLSNERVPHGGEAVLFEKKEGSWREQEIYDWWE